MNFAKRMLVFEAWKTPYTLCILDFGLRTLAYAGCRTLLGLGMLCLGIGMIAFALWMMTFALWMMTFDVGKLCVYWALSIFIIV